MGNPQNPSKPTTITQRLVLNHKRLKVRKDFIRWPNGKPGEYMVVEIPDAVCIVCVRDNHVLTVTQFRYPTQTISVEFPMGGAGGEGPHLAAKRELREETGYTATEWTSLGKIQVLNGLVCMWMYLFTAENLTLGETAHEDGEQGMTMRWISLTEWRNLIASGQITDAETLAAWAVYQAKYL